MPIQSTILRSAVVCALCSASVSLLNASPLGSISQMFVFGDSLSDSGNAAIALGGSLPGNYSKTEFTDGPKTTPPTAGPFGLWIDQFAAKSGLADPTPYLANPLNTTNINYAVASAQTGAANPQDIGNQVTAFALGHSTGGPSNALYAFWGGANDILDGTSTGASAADALASYISLLASGGAKYFMWFNLPLLGDTPLGASGFLGSPSSLNASSLAFDSEWALDIAALQSKGIYVIGVDVESLFNNVLADPTKYGFTNVTSPAQGTTGNPNDYLFWDGEHPTTAGDALVANLAYNDLLAAPEPVSAGLTVLGIAAVALLRRTRRVPSAIS